MRRIIVFGNSGSGKSTLARLHSAGEDLAHLDLDTLAWLPTNPPQRAELSECREKIEAFMARYQDWVIEGCYTDLLEIAAPFATEAIFMNLPIEACQENARNRPWEPHKYPSKEAQDANLPMLLGWIAQYTERDDVFSHAAHQAFYRAFPATKREVTENLPSLST
ncbi:shikimate kinase [Proteobacteria bacterium 005FR1]|nr:shikimate kinase [Proteobacteria bacterium 005FR1]